MAFILKIGRQIFSQLYIRSNIYRYKSYIYIYRPIRQSCDISDQLFSYWEGRGLISTRPFGKTFQNFPPPFLRGRGLQNLSADDDENIEKWELIQGEGIIQQDMPRTPPNVHKSTYKVIIKKYHKKKLLKTTFWPSVFMVFTSEVLKHLIIYERASLAAFLGVSFD